MTVVAAARVTCKKIHGGPRWSEPCPDHARLLDVVAAAASLDRILDAEIEHALWLDRRASTRALRARCRLATALARLDENEK